MMIPFMYATAACKNCSQADIVQNEENLVKCRKKYIEPEQIAFIDHKIFVEIENYVVEAPAIFNDAGGFFIQNIRANSRGCGPIDWECGNCGHCNVLWESCCLICNRDRNGKRCN